MDGTAMTRHSTAVVISDVARLVYLTNLKAASSSITAWLLAHAHGRASCHKHIRNMSSEELSASCCDFPNGHGQLTTRCLGPQHAGYLLFSFVRNPVTKFESGVRELWVRAPSFRKYSADQLLHAVLKRTSDHSRTWDEYFPTRAEWIDQHLEPSWWRLSGETRIGGSLHASSAGPTVGFVGHVENFDRDWKKLLSRWPPLRKVADQIDGGSRYGDSLPAHVHSGRPAWRVATHVNLTELEQNGGLPRTLSCRQQWDTTFGW